MQEPSALRIQSSPKTGFSDLGHLEGLRPLPPTPEKRRAPIGFQFVASSLRLAALLSCLCICAHVRAHVCVRRPVRKAPHHPDQDFEERSLSASKTLFFQLKTAPGPPRRLIRKAPEQDLAESFLSASKTSAFPFKTAPEPPRRPARRPTRPTRHNFDWRFRSYVNLRAWCDPMRHFCDRVGKSKN